MRGQAPPPVHRVPIVSLRLGLLGQFLERVRESGGEALPLGLDPALELRGAAQVEAVEKGTVVEASRCFQFI